jgi:hypothetical protein
MALRLPIEQLEECGIAYVFQGCGFMRRSRSAKRGSERSGSLDRTSRISRVALLRPTPGTEQVSGLNTSVVQISEASVFTGSSSPATCTRLSTPCVVGSVGADNYGVRLGAGCVPKAASDRRRKRRCIQNRGSSRNLASVTGEDSPEKITCRVLQSIGMPGALRISSGHCQGKGNPAAVTPVSDLARLGARADPFLAPSGASPDLAGLLPRLGNSSVCS